MPVHPPSVNKDAFRLIAPPTGPTQIEGIGSFAPHLTLDDLGIPDRLIVYRPLPGGLRHSNVLDCHKLLSPVSTVQHSPR